MNFVKKCVIKVSEACEIKPQEGKWVYVDYGSQMYQPGEYLQPMVRLRANQEDRQDGEGVLTQDRYCHSCSASSALSTKE